MKMNMIIGILKMNSIRMTMNLQIKRLKKRLKEKYENYRKELVLIAKN